MLNILFLFSVVKKQEQIFGYRLDIDPVLKQMENNELLGGNGEWVDGKARKSLHVRSPTCCHYIMIPSPCHVLQALFGIGNIGMLIVLSSITSPPPPPWAYETFSSH